MINVLIAEDHTIVRNGIKMLLQTDSDINIVGEATCGADVIEQMSQSGKVDLLLTDIQMQEMDGIMLISKAKAINAETEVVVLSMHNDVSYIGQAFAQGASGYLLKECNTDELLFAIKQVASGRKYICMDLSVKLLELCGQRKSTCSTKQQLNVEFSERELEVLRLIGEGMTNDEMSDKLFLSKRTIEGHRQSLLNKTGSRNTATLIRFAVINGFID